MAEVGLEAGLAEWVTPFLWWCGAITGLAAGLKALEYLIRKGRGGWVSVVAWRVERERKQQVLEELVSEEGWPNGATSLKQSHYDIYERVAGVDMKIDELRRLVEVYMVNLPVQ